MGARWAQSRQRSRQARPAGGRAAAATPARGSTKREDKDSLTVGSRTAFRRLGCRGEDKDLPEFLIFPRRAVSADGAAARIRMRVIDAGLALGLL